MMMSKTTMSWYIHVWSFGLRLRLRLLVAHILAASLAWKLFIHRHQQQMNRFVSRILFRFNSSHLNNKDRALCSYICIERLSVSLFFSGWWWSRLRWEYMLWWFLVLIKYTCSHLTHSWWCSVSSNWKHRRSLTRIRELSSHRDLLNKSEGSSCCEMERLKSNYVN